MAKLELRELVGPVAFYIGLAIAVGAAFIEPTGRLYIVLGIIGVIVGLLNITTRETRSFLIASIAFIVAAFGMYWLISTAFIQAGIAIPEVLGEELLRLAANLSTLVGGAAMVVALKSIYEAAKGV